MTSTACCFVTRFVRIDLKNRHIPQENIHFVKIHRYEYIDNDRDDVVTDLLISTQSTLSMNVNCCLGMDKTDPSKRNHVMEMKRIPDMIQCQQKLDELMKYLSLDIISTDTEL